MSSPKTVAIIGAGSSGLTAAKYSVENGLMPTIFEKFRTIGGLWAPENKQSAVWDGLTANVSYYFMSFSDHTYPEKSPIFSGKREVFAYLTSYMKKFDLEKYISYNTQVLEASQLDDNRWNVSYQSEHHEPTSKTFDFLIIASGLHETPHIPEFENQCNFKGLQLHSSQFFLKDPRLKDKKVLVLGNSYSGADVSQLCVGHASSVVNVFNRPYLIARRLIRFKNNATKFKENVFNVAPTDCIFFTRHLKNDGETIEEKMKLLKGLLKCVNPEQTNKEKSHPALYYDVNSGEEPRLTIADNYWDYVKQNKITPKKTTIKKFAENGVHLNDGSFEKCDVIVYATGYNLSIQYLDDNAKKLIEFDPDNYKMPYVQYKLTFHPNLKNLGFVCQNDGVFFTAAELQSKWIASVFSGKMSLPSREEMLKQVSSIREKRDSKNYVQYVFGEHVEIVDILAEQLNMLPDFEKIKKSDPELYHKLWNNLVIASHFVLGTQHDDLARKLVQEVDDLTNYECTFDDNDPSKYVSISLLAKKFSTNPKYKINMDIFHT